MLAVVSLTAPPIEISGSLVPSSGPKARAKLRVQIKNISTSKVVLPGPVSFPYCISVKSYDEKGVQVQFTSYARGMEVEPMWHPAVLRSGESVTAVIRWERCIQKSLKGRYSVIFVYRPEWYPSIYKKWNVLRGSVYSKPLKILIGERDVRVL
jgi:hypothetical protein